MDMSKLPKLSDTQKEQRAETEAAAAVDRAEPPDARPISNPAADAREPLPISNLH